MANLYEINQAIIDAVDYETGEILDPEALDQLIMARDEKIENIACYIKNLTSDAAAYKAEKDAFAERERLAKNKAGRLRDYLSGFLNGQKFSSSRVSISFRRTKSVDIPDNDLFIKHAREDGREDLIRMNPEPNKEEIKKALEAGEDIPGAQIVEKQSMIIK